MPRHLRRLTASLTLAALVALSAPVAASAAAPASAPRAAPPSPGLKVVRKTVMKPHDGRQGAAAASTPVLTNPMTFHGGALPLSSGVIATPKAYLVFTGDWSGTTAAQAYITNFFTDVGGSAWGAIDTQYTGAGGLPVNNIPSLGGTWNDTTGVSFSGETTGAQNDTDLANETARALAHFGPTLNSSNSVIFVFTAQGVAPYGFPGSPSPQYCAYHSWYFPSPYTAMWPNGLIPFLPDVEAHTTYSCYDNYGSTGLSGFSIVGGHEFAEAVTDADPGCQYRSGPLTGQSCDGWYNDVFDPRGPEIGDLCDIGHTGITNQLITLSHGHQYYMQPLFSNAAISAGQTACQFSIPPPARYTTVSNLQYSLPDSDGSTWVDMDPLNLSMTVTPSIASYAIISGNIDLWTASAGYNQDVGIRVSGGALPNTGQPEGWKESGGFAGTFSPNAAEVQVVVPMAAATAYQVFLDWKANQPALGAAIFAGAGPFPGGSGVFSPTRLTVTLVPQTASPLATAVTTSQESLADSDGNTWSQLAPDPVSVSLLSATSTSALVTANIDLWTGSAGYNQDVGIFMQDLTATGSEQLVAWKESGGFAGTFSPNAAFVQSVARLVVGHQYLFKLKWKTNQDARPAGATIFAGAGPIGGNFSPTRLSVYQLPSTSVGTGVVTDQDTLAGSPSSGAIFVPMAGSAVITVFNVPSTGNYLIGGNVDLWTANAGYNQDIAIYVDGALAAWKESGGFAGTFSPNAAYVEAVQNLSAGSHTFELRWKTNIPAPGSAAIFAGAGPIAGLYSPARITVIPTN